MTEEIKQITVFLFNSSGECIGSRNTTPDMPEDFNQRLADCAGAAAFRVHNTQAEAKDVFLVGGDVFVRPGRPSPDHVWVRERLAWEFSDPERTQRLQDLIANCLSAIDYAAGAARLRYITSVPGQAETYQRKEEQARAWATAAFANDAPSFIAAEAKALGQDAVQVALEVIRLADFWTNTKGPEIEATRRKWKVAISAVGMNEAAVIAARDSGLEELKGL